jgi:hypothetical protein
MSDDLARRRRLHERFFGGGQPETAEMAPAKVAGLPPLGPSQGPPEPPSGASAATRPRQLVLYLAIAGVTLAIACGGVLAAVLLSPSTFGLGSNTAVKRAQAAANFAAGMTDDLDSRVSDLESGDAGTSDLAQQISDLSGRLDDAESRLDEIESGSASSSTLGNELSDLFSRLDDLDTAIQDLCVQVDAVC